jgi:hypothetical protein
MAAPEPAYDPDHTTMRRALHGLEREAAIQLTLVATVVSRYREAPPPGYRE